MKGVSRSILMFMLKAVAVVSPVVAIAMGWYVATDPYKVLRRYNAYLPDPRECPVRVGINKGLITVTNYEQRVAEGRRYNAFIFGSSVSCYYDARLWAQMADTTGGASAYHFDSSGETLSELADKVEYLDGIGQPIEYALIVLDPIVMRSDDISSPATINPPQLHRNFVEYLRYHYTFFRAAVNADFFKSWIPYKVTGKEWANGRNLVFEPQPIVYDPEVNEESIPQWDSIIAVNPDEFYARYPLAESPESVAENDVVLTRAKVMALRRVADVFSRQETDYQIIIGPNRLKVAINGEDLAVLRRIFKSSRVHDFSEEMAKELEGDTLLYDNTHYRAVFATELMRRVYGSRKAE